MGHRDRKLHLSLEEAIKALLPPTDHPSKIVAQLAREHGKKRKNWGTVAVLAARLVVDQHPERSDHVSLYYGVIVLKGPEGKVEIQLDTVLSALRGMGDHGKRLHSHIHQLSRYWQLHPDHTHHRKRRERKIRANKGGKRRG